MQNIELTVQFQCGCGFISKKVPGDYPGAAQKAAIAHVEQTGHCLTITGTVREGK